MANKIDILTSRFASGQIVDVTLDELHVFEFQKRFDVLDFSFGQIVQNTDLTSIVVDQIFDDVGADETGSTRY